MCNKIEINISNYLSEDEIKEICKEQVKERISQILKTEQDIHRFLSNSSYRFVWEAIDERFPENMLDTITEKISGIVNELSELSVFRAKNPWSAEDSKGYILLEKALTDAEPLIKARIVELVSQIDMHIIRDALTEQIDNVIENLSKKERESDE